MEKNLLKNLINIVNKNKFFIIAFLVFFAVRIFILKNPPDVFTDKGFSVVKSDYERYVNIWWYGLPPYLKHLYEYPPATIPLLIIPLAMDLAGIGIYYFNYRWLIFFIEIFIYFFIIKFLAKFFPNSFIKYSSMIFYNIGAIVSKNFWYDGIDLPFAGSLTLALISYFLIKKQSLGSKILFWALFWLSVAIKLITLPLLVPFLLIKNTNLKEEIKGFVIGFLIIWGVPLAIFRSSLSVFLYFHAKRPLHTSSFPAYIVYTLNHFTHSDEMINLEWFGPLTQKALFWSFIFLGINTCLVIVWSIKRFLINQKQNHYTLMVKTSAVYLIIFILSGKIFSTPFNIWYILLFTIFPYKNKKEQIIFFLLIAWSLIFNATNIFNHIPQIMMIYPFTWNYLRHLLRFPPLIFILLLIIKRSRKSLSSH